MTGRETTISVKTANYSDNLRKIRTTIAINNEIKADFIPCYRITDNEIGLYNLVDNQFYTNQGTGEFLYG